MIAGATGSHGSSDCDIWLIRTDSLGNEIWNKTFGGSNGDMGRSVKYTRDGGYIIVGTTSSYANPSGGEIWLIKTTPETGVEESAKFKVQNAKLGCYPNPFTNSTTIFLKRR